MLVAMACHDDNSPAMQVASITLSLDSARLLVGDSLRLTATVRDQAGTVVTGPAITWSSSSPTVAAVQTPGIVHALARGETRITATTEGVSADALILTALPEVMADTIRGDTADAVEAGRATTVTIPAGMLPPGTSVRVEELDSPSDAAGHTLVGSSVHLTVEPPATSTSGQSRAASSPSGLATMTIQLTTDAVSSQSALRGWLRANVKTAASLDYFFAPNQILPRTTLSGKSVLDLFFDVSLPSTGGNVVLSVTDVTLVCGDQAGFLYTPGYGKSPPGPADESKIPLVLVHGWQWRNTTCESFANDWWPEDHTWSDLISLINQDPTLSKAYQIWLFKYPTVQNISVSARQLRQQFDAHIGKPSVILGHSMGGVVAAYATVNDSASQAMRGSHLLTMGAPLAGTPLAVQDWQDVVENQAFLSCAGPVWGSVEFFARGAFMDDSPGVRDLAPNSSTIQFIQGRLGNIADKISTWGGDLSLTDLPRLITEGTDEAPMALGNCVLRALGVPDNDGLVAVTSARSIVGSSPGATVPGASHEELKSAPVLEETIIPRLRSLSATVQSVRVSPAQATLDVGGTQQFVATVKDADGNTLTDRTVTWSSSDNSVATVDASAGVAKAVAAGTAMITATSEGKSGSATLTVAALPNSADLSITKNGPGTATAGTNFNYTIVVNNTAGSSDASNVIVKDTLPAGLTFVSAPSATGTVVYSATDRVLTWVVGTLAASGSGSLTLTVTPGGAGTVSNRAWLSSATPDPNAANNRSTATVTVVVPVLQAPTLLTPADGVTGTTDSTTFSWTTAPGASDYQIVISPALSDLPPDRYTACLSGYPTCFSATVAVTSASLDSLVWWRWLGDFVFDPGTTYYWRVQPILQLPDSQVPGNWSTIWSFTTAPIPSSSPRVSYSGQSSPMALDPPWLGGAEKPDKRGVWTCVWTPG